MLPAAGVDCQISTGYTTFMLRRGGYVVICEKEATIWWGELLVSGAEPGVRIVGPSGVEMLPAEGTSNGTATFVVDLESAVEVTEANALAFYVQAPGGNYDLPQGTVLAFSEGELYWKSSPDGETYYDTPSSGCAGVPPPTNPIIPLVGIILFLLCRRLRLRK
jgi:hypothetical protein